MLLCIRLGKWQSRSTLLFVYERVYLKGNMWTPFCYKRFISLGYRYNTNLL